MDAELLRRWTGDWLKRMLDAEHADKFFCSLSALVHTSKFAKEEPVLEVGIRDTM